MVKICSELLKEWKQYYLDEYAGDKRLPAVDANTIRKSKKEQIYQQVKVSPGGEYIAYVTNDWGQKKDTVFIIRRQANKRSFSGKNQNIEQVTDNSYPVLAWHPNGKILTYINEEKGGLVMYFYRIDEKKTEKRNLLYFDKVLDFSYSPEGSRLILSAVKDGITDLYIHTISSGTNEQITRDIADDLHPSFVKDSQDEIIFLIKQALRHTYKYRRSVRKSRD